jgi:2-keto-4-pentenoate hydratase/2-oxohepta-3-ene-1,7-dioic acid hydratase in catechol pathway
MKLFTFKTDSHLHHLGALLGDARAIDVTRLLERTSTTSQADPMPRQVLDLIEQEDQGASLMAAIANLSEETQKQYAIDFGSIHWCAPIVRPKRNIFCVGRNYKAHIIEGNIARGRDLNDFPKAVEFFTKPPSTASGHLGSISAYGDVTKMLDYEVELAIVIGKGGINIAEENAMEHVFGYTIINDITARDLQSLHGQWFKGKALDGTCPMGPFIVPSQFIERPEQLRISLEVNGEPRQESNTSDLLFGIPEIIFQLSKGMALEPGDVIATGTPSGVGLGLNPQKFLRAGDRITAHIESIGTLTTTII